MQFILFLLVLFVIGCMFYGISSGVQVTTKGVAKLANGGVAKTDVQPAALSSAQRCLHELQKLHELYQSGALSRDEFEQFKQLLLSSITPTASQAGKESA